MIDLNETLMRTGIQQNRTVPPTGLLAARNQACDELGLWVKGKVFFHAFFSTKELTNGGEARFIMNHRFVSFKT